MCARSNKKRLKGDEGMREIKFRAWDKYTEEMWNVETLHIEDEYVDLFKTNIYEKPLENPWAKISDVILMQYTGLKDKNGVEIYEGDIVRFTNSIDEVDNEVGKVIWEQSECNFVAQYKTTNRVRQEENGTTITIYLISNETYREDVEYEVIGNIYESPELLESKKD